MATAADPNKQPTAAGGEPAAAAGGTPTPQRDWAKEGPELEKKYSELESWRKEREPTYEKYSKYGTPEQIENALRWAQQGILLDQKIRAGEYVPKGSGAPPQPSADPFDTYDELDGRGQARVMRDYLTTELRKLVTGELDPYNKRLEQLQSSLAGQLQLISRTMPLLAKNPDLNPEELFAESVEEYARSPEKMLQLIVERKMAPQMQAKTIKEAVDKALEEERARVKQESENQRAKFFSRSAGPLVKRGDPKTRGDRMRTTHENFLKRLDALERTGTGE